MTSSKYPTYEKPDKEKRRNKEEMGCIKLIGT